MREWKDGTWVPLDPEGTISDPALAVPLPVRALLDRAAANRAVVQALKAKQDPAILEIEDASLEKGLEQGRQQGLEQGLAQGITTLCAALGIPLDADRRAYLQSLDSASLQALLTTIGTERRWP